MKKRFVHICEEFEYMWLRKDNGLIPIYINQDKNWRSEIWTFDLKKDLKENIEEVEIVKVKMFCSWLRNFASWTKFIKRLYLYIKLLKEAKDIDVLMLFHMTKSSYWNAYIYKKLNPKGKVYVKGDFNLKIYQNEISIINTPSKTISEFFRKRRYTSEYKKRRKLANILDILSYESMKAYEVMEEEYAGVSTKGKVIYLPNGVDDLGIENSIEKKSSNKKENILLVVGRLGEYAKNTEAILEALNGKNLKEWKVFLIGRITDKFKSKIEEFYINNPDKKESVVFKGPIYDRKELGEYYNRSKVFLMPSRWESFGIAMVEALNFGNYLITTPTSAVEDITDKRRVGLVIHNENELSQAIDIILEEKINFEEEYYKAIEHSKNFRWSNLIETLKKEL